MLAYKTHQTYHKTKPFINTKKKSVLDCFQKITQNCKDTKLTGQSITDVTPVLIVAAQFFRLQKVPQQILNALIVRIGRKRQLQLSEVVFSLALGAALAAMRLRHRFTAKRVLNDSLRLVNGTCSQVRYGINKQLATQNNFVALVMFDFLN